ncbi:YciI family protein [Edaphobacter bradus]|uniref:YciI family protein n=1 Tax=Edaphobacter bradus TaxID=2259016 RepID=UPI0021E07E6A|nr:YciI family protein [Edaphobacter bradus]
MVMRKMDKELESGALPGKELLAAMGRYNDEMRAAGVLLDCEWLTRSSKGARVNLNQGKMTVTDGPFAEVKEMIAGFVLMEVGSMEEAIAWAKRCPALTEGAEIEIRQVTEASDFPADLAEELRSHASKRIAADAKVLVSERELARA